LNSGPLGRFPVRRIRVRGLSMVPALKDQDVVLVRRTDAPGAGDIVLVTWASRPGQLSIKRVVRRDAGGWFVTGDNTYASTDSRDLGPAEVHGVVVARLWPKPQRARNLA
jgi:nickel-type superoxide dismutase maturation protease